MKAERKKAVIIIASFVILAIIVVFIALLLFDINSFKSRIETDASRMTGLDVKINGKVSLSFFPFGLSAKDMRFANKEGEILSLEHIKLGTELIPLLKKQLRVTNCDLVRPTITIIKDVSGKYNFENTTKKSTKGWAANVLSFKEIKVSKGTLVYHDKTTDEKTELKDINLVIKDLSIGDTTGDIIKNASFTGTMECKEILQKNFSVGSLTSSVTAVKGLYNFHSLIIKSFVYHDKTTDEKTELKDINLVIKDLSIGDTTGDIIKNASFTGTMECVELRKKDLQIDNIKSGIKAEKGVLYLKPLTIDIFGAKGEGDVEADRTEADSVYTINLSVTKLDLDKLQDSFAVERLIGGKGDLVASLQVKEKEGQGLIKGMNGTLSLRGDNLITYTMDLDAILSTYEASQTFSLIDVGAFFIAGPLGSAALKGYRYGDVYYQTRGGRGTITQFVSQWKVKDGVAEATDCALATRGHRVALKGKLNLVTERYDNVIVALLDGKGCTQLKQGITGSFSAPQVGVVSAMESLADPILHLYRKAKRFVQGGKCEVFYNGAVKQPR